jgi:dihydropteroate synthase
LVKAERIPTEQIPEVLVVFNGTAEDGCLYLDEGIDIWFEIKPVSSVPDKIYGLCSSSGVMVYVKPEEKGEAILLGGNRLAFKSLLARWTDDPLWKQAGEEMAFSLGVPFSTRPATVLAGKEVIWGAKTYVMGILNVTPDSFFDGGQYGDLDSALKQVGKMVEEGADIIDVGGESTRPGADPLDAEMEIERVVPVIKEIAQRWKVPVSIDTYKSSVAKAALEAGASFINDVTGFGADKELAKVAADYGVPVCLQHIMGTPQNMQKDPRYLSVVPEIMDFLRQRVEYAQTMGVKPENILIDPGFGFGKRLEHNLNLLKRLRHLKSLGYPLLIGTSRKSMIGLVLDQPPGQRLEGTAATVALAVTGLADMVRVHDVGFMVKVAKMADAVFKCNPA